MKNDDASSSVKEEYESGERCGKENGENLDALIRDQSSSSAPDPKPLAASEVRIKRSRTYRREKAGESSACKSRRYRRVKRSRTGYSHSPYLVQEADSSVPLLLFDIKEHKRVSSSCLQIREENGEWKHADLYEFDSSTPTARERRVVMHFGGLEFEGLDDHVCRLQLTGDGGFDFSGDPAHGKLLDKDGELISTRSEEHPDQGSPSLL
jgi:hypothetical protein